MGLDSIGNCPLWLLCFPGTFLAVAVVWMVLYVPPEPSVVLEGPSAVPPIFVTTFNQTEFQPSSPHTLPRSLSPNVTQLLPVRFVVPPFGWSGSWHPLWKSGLTTEIDPNLLQVEIAPKNFRPIMGRLNIKFDVVEPFAIPTTYAKLADERQVLQYISKQESRWYLTLTLCPFTAEWVNEMVGSHSRVPVFYPVDPKYLPTEPVERIYDVMLASSKTAAFFLKPIVPVIARYKHVLLKKASNESAEGATEAKPTHVAPVSHQEKLLLYSQSKAAIVWNCYSVPPGVTSMWRALPSWKLIAKHKAFATTSFTEWSFFPQLKSRTFEAALAGSLLLAFWDKFKIIENWFEPGKEFLYWFYLYNLCLPPQ